MNRHSKVTKRRRSLRLARLRLRRLRLTFVAAPPNSSLPTAKSVKKPTATAGDIGSLNFNEKPVAHDGKIQLVDWKQAPAPTPNPGHSGQMSAMRSKIFREAAVHSHSAGSAAEQDLRNLWDWASEGWTPSTGSNYPGTQRLLPDGTRIGMRKSDDHGPTMEIRTPDKSYTKIHVNDARGGVPEIPTHAAGPREGAAPEQHAPAESAPVEDTPAEAAAPRPAPEPSAPMGPAGSNPFPHFVEPPHSHHGPPILGRNDLSDPEFESP